jgi:two-component system, NtrC family, sensor kinase
MTVKVLIVDDEAPIRRLVMRILSHRGYECHAVDSAEAARRSLANAKADLLISDIRMPGESGIDLIRSIIHEHPQMAILMVSGMDNVDVIDAVIDIGVDGYITKPFESNQLRVGAELALSHRRLSMESDRHRHSLERIVTERTRELEQTVDDLTESEAEFRAIAENAQDAIIKIDDRGHVTYWNGSAEGIFGYAATEVVGKSLHQLISPSRYLDEIRRAMEHFRQTGEGSSMGNIVELTAKNKNGKEFPVELSIASFRLNGAWHAIGIVRNITARKQMEDRLVLKNKKLEATQTNLETQNRQLEKLHKELQRAQQQTLQQEKMASIGQLAAGVAHEINNPTGFVSSNLRSLQGYLEDLFRLIDAYENLRSVLEINPSLEVASAEIAERLTEIGRIVADIDLEFLASDALDLIKESREGTERIKKIVIDLKDFAHPGQQKCLIAEINHNLESVLNIVWNELRYKAVVHKNFGELPPVECYPQQLNQVFMNLLVNAGQAMEAMGEIHITTRADGDGVVIEIRDTGCGIPKANLQHIFDPFFTTKPVGKGTGLGLNVAYNIVKKHGGAITAVSQPGEGTVFTIRLPLVLPESDPAEDGDTAHETGETHGRQAS